MKRFVKWLAVGVVVLAIGVVQARPASALSNIGPDPNDATSTFAGAEFAYGISSADHEFASIPNTRVFLYFANNTGSKSVVIVGGDTCTDRQNSALNGTGGNYWDRPYQTNAPDYPSPPPANWGQPGVPSSIYGGFGQTASRFSVGGVEVQGVFSDSDTCFRDERTLTFPGSALTYDANTGRYKATFLAAMEAGTSNAQNHFKLRLTDPAGIIGYDAGLSENSTSILRYNRNPAQTGDDGYADYSFAFAPDCTVGTSQLASGYWYDDDNDSAATQPQRFWMQLHKYRVSDGGYVGPVPMNFYDVNGLPPGPLVQNGPVDTSYYVNSGNKNNVRMEFLAESGYKYIWRWNHVFHRNVLQFRLPFDSIYYITGCHAPSATVRPSSAVDKDKITYPDTATFTHYLDVTQFTQNAQVNYTITRTRNGANIATRNGSFNVTTNGLFGITDPGGVFNSGAGDAGDRICEYITLTATSGETITFNGNPSTPACLDVTVRPYLTVTNNDVWAGSRFDYDNNLCAAQTARLSSISSWVNGGAGAVGEYGVLSLGPVTEFGSAAQAGGNRLTFANAPSLGNFGANARCVSNYYGVMSAAGGEAWTGFAGLTANAGAKKYFIDGDVTLDAGTVPSGTQALLVVNGNVTIRGNITYNDSYDGTRGRNAPPLLWVIAKGDIRVQENVTNMNGFYVAQGTAVAPGKIHTCVQTGGTTTYTPLTANRCTQGLDVYGAFLADQILWQRTRGTAGSGTYAESVQFDPALYIGSPWTSATANSLKVENLTELPPVY